MADHEQMVYRTLTKAQVNFLLQRTPREEVFTRPGKGGKAFTYVEIGYVISTLNQVFGFRWNFTILDRIREETEVGVLGRLEVTSPTGETIVKDQFGQSDIKKDRQGIVLSIVDDYKAAASDALKKCASLLGIAGDVYGRERPVDLDIPEAEEAPKPVPMKVIGGNQRPIPVEVTVPLPVKGSDLWGGFQDAVITKLEELGCADKLINQLVLAIRTDLEIRGDLDDRDAMGAIYRGIKEWTTSSQAVLRLNELSASNSRRKKEAQSLERMPMRKDGELFDE